MRKTIVLVIAALLLVPSASLSPVSAEAPDSRYFRVRTKAVGGGRILSETLISGPPDPPAGYLRAKAEPPVPSVAAGVNILSDVPAFDWSFGCSATSAAMIAGYYDRSGYPNMYVGPTNGGVMPLDNSSWGYWYDGANSRAQCPLSATHDGLDGRTTKGHVDDYWIVYGNAGPDPFIGNWTEHAYGDCTSDYMKTNQSTYGNVDGGTTFWNYTSGSPLHCSSMPGGGIDNDGGYGLMEFYQSRGYSVTACYNQYIRGQGSNPLLGFTYDQYKAEIDAGRPVMFHVQGHTMVGIGYDDATDQMYIHDTWDYDVHTMTWGGSYSGMRHYGVTIVQLAPTTSTPPDAPSGLAATAAGSDGIDLNWTDNSADETGSRIERSPDSSNWAQIAAVGANISGYSDTGLAPGTTYYYWVYAFNTAGNSGYSNVASATTEALGGEDVARADYVTTYGGVAGTYQATHTQDDAYQSITEQHSRGKPSRRHDRLEHIWQFDLTGGNHIFNVDAYYVEAGDGDSGFVFSWSASESGPWNHLLTVVETADDDAYQAADMGSVSGTIYVRAIDNDRISTNNSNDTLHVDHMYVDGGGPVTEPPGPAANEDPANGATDVSTSPALSWRAGARTESHDVFLGTVSGALAFQGRQTATTFTPEPPLNLGTTYYWRIDEANAIGVTEGPEWSFTTRSNAGPTSMHVDSIMLDTVKAAKGTVRGRATVVMVDDFGDSVETALVGGVFSGAYDDTLSDATDVSGTAVIVTAGSTKKPSFTFCVDVVTHADLTYESSDNDVTCASYR